MSDITRSLIAGGVVVLGIGAIVAGLVIRDHQDLGDGSHLTLASVDGLVASRVGAEVPADKYFAEMVEKLKREYVDEITDDQKLASGSVRGMVASLNDPNSVFMDAKEFAAYKEAVSGHYQGIGVELSLQDSQGKASTGQGDSSKDEAVAGVLKIPKLTVVGLTPGGPAAKAGVQIGDSVEYVDGRWLIQAEPIMALRALTAKVDQKKAPMSDLIKVRKVLRAKLEKSVLPLRAKDELMLGSDGTVNVVWTRGKQELKTTLKREKSEALAFGPDAQGVVHLTFAPGDVERFKEAIKGKSALTVDLRESPLGEFATMKECLSLVAPKGDYGVIESERQGKSHPLTLAGGTSGDVKLTLLVDKSTRGPSEIFALALQSKGLAKVEGGPMAGHRYIIETVELPDGSGYTLVTGKYRAPSEKAAERVVRPAPKPVAIRHFDGEVDA